MRQAIVALLILMSIVSALMLSGCQEQVFPAIQAVSLTEQENNLLTSVGVKRYFVFDIDRKQIEFDNMAVKVDYYVNGEFKETITLFEVGGFSPSEQTTERLVWSQLSTNNEQEEVWNFVFAGGRTVQLVQLDEEIKGLMWTYNQLIPTVKVGEEVLLAAIVGDNTGNGIRSPGIIFDQDEGGVVALKEYDLAYVLKVIFW